MLEKGNQLNQIFLKLLDFGVIYTRPKLFPLLFAPIDCFA